MTYTTYECLKAQEVSIIKHFLDFYEQLKVLCSVQLN